MRERMRADGVTHLVESTYLLPVHHEFHGQRFDSQFLLYGPQDLFLWLACFACATRGCDQKRCLFIDGALKCARAIFCGVAPSFLSCCAKRMAQTAKPGR